jgi:signal transduction histidine kinase
VLALAVAALVAVEVPTAPWAERGALLVAAWCAFCAAANVLPVPAIRHVSLSMGAPVNVAIASLFPPGMAAAIVFVSSLSEWEVKRSTTVSHALFNRTQLAASAALASFVFTGHRTVDGVPPVLVVIAAVVVYQAANWVLVGLAELTARGVPVRRVLRDLLPAGAIGAATYLVLGFEGVALALTSVRVGVWAVVLVMLPLLGARHAVNASGELERAERERRSLGDRLIDERERERVRIAGDIHDVVLQQLAALQLEADSIGAALDHEQPEVAVRLAGQLRTGVDDAITELRRTIASLRRASMDEGGLGPSLVRFARGFRSSTGLDVEVAVGDGVDPLPLPVALLLFECGQEALTNVVRHAPSATRIAVSVERTGAAVELVVRDDGPGFVGVGEGEGGRRSGLALHREKVALSGGLLFVDSRPGHGTIVTVRVPVGASW